METRVLESTVVLFFVALHAQHSVQQWILVLRQFPVVFGRKFHVYVLVNSYPEVDSRPALRGFRATVSRGLLEVFHTF